MTLKKVHVYLYQASVAFFYFLLWPLLYFFSRHPKRYKSLNAVRRFWCFITSCAVGIRYYYEYEEPIDWSKTYMVCPNHTSNLDISAMCILVKNDCSFMGKQELADGLVTGIFFRTVDIPVNRDSKMSAFRAFKKASEKLESGITMVIFPEGMISDTYPPRLCEFKNGPFRMAIEHKIPILPVSSIDTWKTLWDTGLKYGSKPGVCHIHVHKPIDTSTLTIADADALRDEVYQIINNKLEGTNELMPV